MSKELKEIQAYLRSIAKEDAHRFYETAIPGAERVYGVKTPVLNELVKKYKDGSFDLAAALWKSGWFEERIIAVKIMEKKGKQDPERLLRMFDEFSKTIDNWAVCDGLGMQFLRGIVLTHADAIFKRAETLSRSKDFWQRRLALVIVEWYTRKPEYDAAIMKLVDRLRNDEAYYVRKAVAWIERNYKNRK